MRNQAHQQRLEAVVRLTGISLFAPPYVIYVELLDLRHGLKKILVLGLDLERTES